MQKQITQLSDKMSQKITWNCSNKYSVDENWNRYFIMEYIIRFFALKKKIRKKTI